MTKIVAPFNPRPGVDMAAYERRALSTGPPIVSALAGGDAKPPCEYVELPEVTGFADRPHFIVAERP